MSNIFGENCEEIGITILMEFDAIRTQPIKHPDSRSRTLFFDYFFRKTTKNPLRMTMLQKNVFFRTKNNCPLTAWGCRECDCLRDRFDFFNSLFNQFYFLVILNNGKQIYDGQKITMEKIFQQMILKLQVRHIIWKITMVIRNCSQLLIFVHKLLLCFLLILYLVF